MAKQIILCAISLLLITSVVSAVEVADVEIPDTRTVEGHKLILNGAGLREFLFMDFYAAGFYIKNKSSDAARILEADEPMAIYIQWVATADVSAGHKALSKGFAVAKKYYDYPKHQEETEKFTNWTEAPEDGTIWFFYYIPGKGTTFIVDGKEIGTIPGLDFKKNVFAVWLHDKKDFAGDKGLRDEMLGKE